MVKLHIIIGAFFCLTTVVIGAFGAHALKDILDDYGQSVYNKAVLYQLFHGLGILIVAVLNGFINETNLSIIIYCFAIGIFLFSGSLYVLALSKTKWLGVITPFGGLFFILGWGILILKLLKV
tara:strand:- start:214 stop:582 length:369 start_codon:yes stop_codon:yes gene_type:complete